MSLISCSSIGKVLLELSYSLLDFAIAILTSFRIFSNFDGGNREMGRYHFDKILMALEYNFSLSINFAYIFTYFSLNVVKNSTEFIA